MNKMRGFDESSTDKRGTRSLPIVWDASGERVTDEELGAAGSVPGGSGRRPDEDIIDAEIVDEEETVGQSFSGSAEDFFRQTREKLRDGARSFFSAQTHERMRQRNEQRAAQDARALDGDNDEQLSARDQLLKLRAEMKVAGDKYMKSLADSKLLVPGFSQPEQAREFNAMHQVHMQLMMQGCLKPLSRGVNVNSIVQAAGMMMVMRMLSPDFRDEMGKYFQPVKDKLTERMDTRTRAVRDSAQQQADMRGELVDAGTQARVARNSSLANDAEFLAGREAKKTGVGDHLSKKWRERMEAMEYRERGNREMFTAESAAMTEVALMENAFWRMRDPQQDAAEVYGSYRSMRKRLRSQMSEDGLDRSEVVKRARLIIGERMEAEPEFRLMFNGISHGRIRKSPPHEARVMGSNQTRSVWSGEFEDQFGAPVSDDAMFTLRRPMDANQHQHQMGATMSASLLRAAENDDAEALQSSMMGYLVGFAIRREGVDTSTLPAPLRAHLDESEVMLASMSVDGISEDEQQRIYSNAFVDAMEMVNTKDPNFEHELRLALGNDWEEQLKSAVDDPAKFFAERRFRPPNPHRQPSTAETDHENTEPVPEPADATDDYQPA